MLSVAYETCCKNEPFSHCGTCFTNKKNCIKACSFANDKITTEAVNDVDNDNQGAGLRGHYLIKSVMEEDAVITNPSSLTVVTNKKIHHLPTVAIGKYVLYCLVIIRHCFMIRTWPIPCAHQINFRRFVYFFLNISASQDWAHCIDNCGTEWGICCGPYSKDDNCLRTTRAAYTLYDKCANEYNTCAGKCPPYDGVTTKVTTDFDNDNEGAGNKPIVADDFIMIQSSLVVALNEEIHHSTVVIGKFVYLASEHSSVTIFCNTARAPQFPLLYQLIISSYSSSLPAETRDPCFGKCSSAFMSCCGINPDCFQKAMANDRTLLNRCNAAKATCQMACPSLAEEDEATNEVTTEFDNDKDETGLLRGHLIKPVMADASGPQDYQCIENCDTGLDICCKIANTADNCILKYKQGEHTWYNNCNSAMYSCRSACPRADDKAPTVTMDIGNEGARLRDNPIKPVLDDTFIMNPSSFAVALNEETFVANGTFAYYPVINPSVMMKMNDV